MLLLSIWPEINKIFTFESFLQCHQSGVDGVFNFHIRFVSLLQKDLCVFGVLSDGSGFPVVEGA
jgi:hypothetical protein